MYTLYHSGWRKQPTGHRNGAASSSTNTARAAGPAALSSSSLSRSIENETLVVMRPQTSLHLSWLAPTARGVHPPYLSLAQMLVLVTCSSIKKGGDRFSLEEDPISFSTTSCANLCMFSLVMGPCCPSRGGDSPRPRPARPLSSRHFRLIGGSSLLKFRVDGRCHVESNPPTRLCMQCIGVCTQLFGRPRKMSPR